MKITIARHPARNRMISPQTWLVMKLTVLLTVVLMNVSAAGISQKVTYTARNASLEDVFSAIKEQTGYVFFYNKGDVDKSLPVTLNLKNASLQSALAEMLKGQPLTFLIKSKTIVITTAPPVVQAVTEPVVAPPPVMIRGRVLNSKGEPVPGAVVTEKGTSNITVTTENGDFVINVKSGSAELEISSVGFTTQTVSLNGRASVDVRMAESVSGLDEVVVVGYGTQKKATLSGSVAQIGGDQIKQSTQANLTNSLAGRVPGLIANNRSGEPGSDGSTLLIRGVSTLGGVNASGPLYVIDGVANRGDFSRLNPDDIESISILKDASAAIYGAQAANGVILITTKRGKSGKPTIQYSGSVGLTQPTQIPDMVGSYDYAIYKNEQYVSGRIPGGASAQFSASQLQKFKDGSDPINYPSVNWYNAVIKPVSLQTNHSLSIRGGSDRIKYFISGQYLNQDGIYRSSADKYNQYNLRANLDAQVTDNLRISLDIAGRIEDRQNPPTGTGQIFLDILGTYPYLQPYYPNGLPVAGIQGMNPLQEAQGANGYDKNSNTYIQNKFSLELKLPWITKGLSLSGFAGYDFRFYSQKRFTHPFDLYRYDSTNKVYNNVRNILGVTSLSTEYRNYLLKTQHIRLSYDRRFGDHNISVFVAAEQSSNYDERLTASRRNFLSNQIDQIFAGSSAPEDMSNGGSANQDARRNFFGRINYGYKDKYLVEFVFRRDGSFNFPPDKRWGNFPGISAAWRISEEPFFKQAAPFVDQLKLRGSYSTLGNDDISAYQFLNQYSLGTGYYLGAGPTQVAVPGITPGVTPNNNVTWEVEFNRNVALEGSLWKGKLDFTIEYYNARRSGILTARSASIPYTTGLRLPPENIGIVGRHGIEIQLGTKGVIGRDFRYNISGNVTRTWNKIIFRDESPNVLAWQKGQGFPISSFLSYPTNGIFKSKEEVDKEPVKWPGSKPGDIRYVDYNTDNVIDSKDQVRVYESATPLLIYGINLDGSYKGFSLSMLWQGQGLAKQMLIPNTANGEFIPPTWIYEGRWTAANPNASLPAAFDRTYTPNIQASDFWIKDVSFLKLRTVELSYTFQPSFLKKYKLTNFRIFVNGNNLISIDKLKGYDPETFNGSPITNGATYPPTKIYTFGVNLSF